MSQSCSPEGSSSEDDAAPSGVKDFLQRTAAWAKSHPLGQAMKRSESSSSSDEAEGFRLKGRSALRRAVKERKAIEEVRRVNFGMALTQPICDAILSTRLRSLRVERVPHNDPFFQMFAMLPMQSPFLEELALGHLAITSAYELTFLDTLCAFRHLSLLRLRALEGDGLGQLAGILPHVVQQNRRTLETLYLEDLDAKTLLSCIAGCRNLRSLEVAKSSSATLRPCADFPSGALELCMKVIARCPKLWSLHLNTVACPDEAKNLERHILQMGRGLQELVDQNVDFYRGLQYNGGMKDDPNRVESDDDD